MKKAGFWLVAGLMLAVAGIASAKEEMPTSWDGLIEVKPKRMDAVYVMPGADFRPYTKVMLDKAQVAFKKDWMKDINDSKVGVSNRVTDEDAAKIMAAAQTGFDDVFKEGFEKAGYSVVTAPGPDVLRLSTAVINLYINAPDVMTAGRSRTYTTSAGEATLVLEARDGATNALLGRVLDRRETRDSGMASMSNSVTNKSDFRLLFKQWVGIATKGLGELKALSPVPADLKPKQKLN